MALPVQRDPEGSYDVPDVINRGGVHAAEGGQWEEGLCEGMQLPEWATGGGVGVPGSKGVRCAAG